MVNITIPRVAWMEKLETTKREPKIFGNTQRA